MSIDTNSDEWKQIKEFCDAEIAGMREENDGFLGKDETNRLRGNIEFAKKILELGETKESIQVQSTKYID